MLYRGSIAAAFDDCRGYRSQQCGETETKRLIQQNVTKSIRATGAVEPTKTHESVILDTLALVSKTIEIDGLG